ncbi:MAG TPA: hypothetical protein VH110_03515 [Candidatus Acidoferrum sp.]|jgi:hypothetical protein|nr:hypothetical protein [Candidatus Acidoferrum sp.]
MEQLINLIALAFAAIAGAFFGWFLKPYLGKKGDLASHEDIDQVRDEVRAVAAAAKEIEAKILGDVWERQKRWELKRDVLFDAVKKSAAVHQAMTKAHAAYQTDKAAMARGESARVTDHLKVGGVFFEATAELDDTYLLVSLVSGGETRKALGELIPLAREIGMKVTDGHPETLLESRGEVSKKLAAVTAAVRKELEIDKTA